MATYKKYDLGPVTAYAYYVKRMKDKEAETGIKQAIKTEEEWNAMLENIDKNAEILDVAKRFDNLSEQDLEYIQSLMDGVASTSKFADEDENFGFVTVLKGSSVSVEAKGAEGGIKNGCIDVKIGDGLKKLTEDNGKIAVDTMDEDYVNSLLYEDDPQKQGRIVGDEALIALHDKIIKETNALPPGVAGPYVKAHIQGVGDNFVSVFDKDYGLPLGNGLGIKNDKSTSTIEFQVNAGEGLTFTGGKLEINKGTGLAFKNGAVSVDLKSGPGIKYDEVNGTVSSTSTMTAKYSEGLEVATFSVPDDKGNVVYSETIYIPYAAGTSKGVVAIKEDGGITVDKDGNISVDWNAIPSSESDEPGEEESPYLSTEVLQERGVTIDGETYTVVIYKHVKKNGGVSVEETVYYDKDGNKVEDEDIKKDIQEESGKKEGVGEQTAISFKMFVDSLDWIR